MKYGLGIDTGGTYTDAVIYDFENNTVLKSSKSLTTKEDLTIGITGALKSLESEVLSQVRLVSLSTTLATNACVEGKGSRAVLVMIGCDPELVQRYGKRYGLPDIGSIVFLAGGHNQQGEPMEEPDWELLNREVEKHRGSVDGFAVVELWGIRNPDFEFKAKTLIMELTGRPVVCAHELTPEINSLKRAASTLLNAQLIPLINSFMNAVKKSLDMLGVSAPVVMVRGDGSLMSEEFARQKPVETLLSGPAASVSGGMHLTGLKDCIIIDMGGTTSDLAIVADGRVMVAHEGVDIGKWKTGTRSIQVSTIGLGGDSRVTYDNDNRILVGPQRVAPLSWLAYKYPSTLGEMNAILYSKKRHTIPQCEFFYLVRDIDGDGGFSESENAITEALTKGPLAVRPLSDAVGSSVYSLNTKRLEKLGIIMRSGLTPTDIMHLTGSFSGFCRDAAAAGAGIMAFQLGISLQELVERINNRVMEALYYNIAKLLLQNDNPGQFGEEDVKQAAGLIMLGFEKSSENTCTGLDKSPKKVSLGISIKMPVVGIGAPVHIFLPEVAQRLNTQCTVPENASVANALGAITGSVSVEEEILIRPLSASYGITGYICYASAGRKEFTGYDEALEWAVQESERLVRIAAGARGAGEPNVEVSINKLSSELPSEYMGESDSENNESGLLFIETIVTARAIGALKWN